jgi:diamine N-acetyltransferase
MSLLDVALTMRGVSQSGIITFLILRETNLEDIDRVLAMEADPDAASFILRWSKDQHCLALRDPDQAHITLEEDERLVGFVLLAGLRNPNRSIELRRIVVSPAGHGLGSRALMIVIDHAFDRLGAHRLWLDVKVYNHRAQRAYDRAGFQREGVLRDALLTDGVFESLVVMSILESERSHGQTSRALGTA